MQLIDTHTHLFDTSLLSQIDQVVSRAQAANVQKIIVVGTTAADSQQAIELAEQFEMISAAVGIQPNCCAEAKPEDWQTILKLVEHPQVVAIGETGLDRYWDFSPFELQQDYFQRHLKISFESGLPFIVHMRDCGEDIVEMLQQAVKLGPLNGVMHSFTGDSLLCQRCLDLGMYISFAGMVTFKKNDELREVVKLVPNDRLLIETDCPYLSPHPKRGQKPNEPALVCHTAECLAKVRDVSLEEIAKLTTNNANRLFFPE